MVSKNITKKNKQRSWIDFPAIKQQKNLFK